MITLYCWNVGQKAGLILSPELLRTHGDALRRASDVYWIDLEQPTPEEEALVLEEFMPVHRLTREEIAACTGRKGPCAFPKVEEFSDYLFVITTPLAQSFLEHLRKEQVTPATKSETVVTQLNAILSAKVLITHHTEHLEEVASLRSFLTTHQEQAGRGPDYLFHLILDAMVDNFAPVLDRLHADLDGIEEEIFEQPKQEHIQRLLALKRLVIQLRKTMVYEREILVRMARGDFSLIESQEIAYYRNVYDHVVRFTELIEGVREMISDLMQLHLSATSNKMNEIMKVLTMISTTVLPMALVTGIYGMNFEFMPETKWDYGYGMALAMMALAGGSALAFFKWRRWF